MSIFVIFMVVELLWLVGGAYVYRGSALARFTAWFVVASTVAVISGLMVYAWLLLWLWQTPEFSLWWLVAICAINAPLALLWKRRVEELQSA